MYVNGPDRSVAGFTKEQEAVLDGMYRELSTVRNFGSQYMREANEAWPKNPAWAFAKAQNAGRMCTDGNKIVMQIWKKSAEFRKKNGR